MSKFLWSPTMPNSRRHEDWSGAGSVSSGGIVASGWGATDDALADPVVDGHGCASRTGEGTSPSSMLSESEPLLSDEIPLTVLKIWAPKIGALVPAGMGAPEDAAADIGEGAADSVEARK